MVAYTRHQPILLLPSPRTPTPSPLPAHTISQSPSPDWFSRDPGNWALGAFSNRDPLPLCRPPPLSRSEPLSAGGGGGGRGGGMADADKPEVLRAAGDDSPHRQPSEPPGEPRREPHPPEQEKQPPQHSSSSNGVKMYCLFLRGPGWGVGREIDLGAGGVEAGAEPWRRITVPGPWAAGWCRCSRPSPGPSPPAPNRGNPDAGLGATLPCYWPKTASHPLFPDFGWRTRTQNSAVATICRKMVPPFKGQ